jgi:hypothetical protein
VPVKIYIIDVTDNLKLSDNSKEMNSDHDCKVNQLIKKHVFMRRWIMCSWDTLHLCGRYIGECWIDHTMHKNIQISIVLKNKNKYWGWNLGPSNFDPTVIDGMNVTLKHNTSTLLCCVYSEQSGFLCFRLSMTLNPAAQTIMRAMVVFMWRGQVFRNKLVAMWSMVLLISIQVELDPPYMDR